MNKGFGVVGATSSMAMGWIAMLCNAHLPHDVLIVVPVNAQHHMPSHGMEGLLEHIDGEVKLEKRQKTHIQVSE